MSLLCRYMLDDVNATQLADISGNALHGTYTGSWLFREGYARAGSLLTQNFVTGRCARVQNGASNYATTGFDPSGLTSFTICGWVWQSRLSPTTISLFGRDATKQFQLSVNGNVATFSAHIGGTLRTVAVTNATIFLQWSFYIVRYDSATSTLTASSIHDLSGSISNYFVSASTTVTGAVDSSAQKIIIGRLTPTASEVTIKDICDVRCYDTYLTDANVYDIFQKSGPKKHLTFDETVVTKSEGDIVSIGAVGSGVRTVTVTAPHNLINGSAVTITGTVNFNKEYVIYYTISSTQFAILDSTASAVESGGHFYENAVINYAGNNFQNTNVNSVTNNQAGIIDKCYLFDGVDDRIGNMSIYGSIQGAKGWTWSSAFTYSLWFKTTSEAAKNIIRIVAQLGTDPKDELSINITAAGKIGTYMINTNTGSAMTTDESFNDGNWHHVCWVRNVTNQYLYVDNLLRKSNATAGTGFQSNSIIFAGSLGALNASLDDLKTFNVAMTVQQVQLLYEEGHGPILCWNYKARYKNTNRTFMMNGGGKFPSELKVPSSVDVSTGIMMDEGKLISPNQFKIIQ